MKQRLCNILIVFHFAIRASIELCKEHKATVTWKRSYKTVTLSVKFYNDLFSDEIAEYETLQHAEKGNNQQ